METVTLIVANIVPILMGISAALVSAAIFAKLTPNQNDDVIIGKIQKYVDGALEFLKSKNQ